MLKMINAFKNIYTFLGLFLLFFGFSGALKAQAPVVALGSVSGCVGDTVIVPINVSNFTNICAVSLEINYDSTALRYVDFNNSALTGNLIVNNPFIGGLPSSRLLISWFNLLPVVIGSGSGLMMNLRFVIQSAPPRAISFNLAVPGQCELADSLGEVVVGVLFTNGGITAPASIAAISTQPTATQSVASGSNAAFSVVATNAVGYQWQQLTTGQWNNLSNSAIFAGVSTNTLQLNSVTPALNGAVFRVAVQGGCPAPVYSNTCTLTVTQAGNSSMQLDTLSACPGDTVSLPVSVSAAVSNVVGLNLGIVYPSGVSFAGISNRAAVLSSLTGTSTTAGLIIVTWSSASGVNLSGNLFNLRFVVNTSSNAAISWDFSNSSVTQAGGSAVSTAFLPGLINNNGATITQQPTGNNLLQPGGSTSFTAAATASTGAGAVSYQWQRNVGGTWTNLTNIAPYSGVQTATLNITNATIALNTAEYRVVVRTASCPSGVNSQSIVLSVQSPALSISNASSCAGDTVAVNFNSSVLVGISGIDIHARYNTQLLRFIGFTGVNSQLASATTSGINGVVIFSWSGVNSINLASGLLFRARFVAISSAPVTFTDSLTSVSGSTGPFLPALTNGAVTVTGVQAQFTQGDTAYICSGASIVLQANTVGGITYEWFKDGVALTNNTSSLSITQPGLYVVRVTATGSTCAPTTDTVRVLTSTAPVAGLSASGSTTFCAGGSVTLSASPAGAGLSYQWLLNGVVVAGASTANYIATAAGVYRVVVANLGGCRDTSTSITLTVQALPGAAITVGGPTSFCDGGSVSLTATSGANFQYRWLRNGAYFGVVTQTYAAIQSGVYRVRIENTATGCFDTSTAITVNVNALPNVVYTASGPLTFCSGDSVVFTTQPGPQGTQRQWLRNNLPVPGATGLSYVARTAGDYALRVYFVPTGCVDTGNVSTVVVNSVAPAPTITVSNTRDTLFSSAAADNQWYKNGAMIPGATNQTLIITGAGLGNGVYSARVIANGCSSDSSNNLNITNVSASALNIGTLKVYPNPTGGQFRISMDGLNMSEVRVVIRNAVGQLVRNELLQNAQTEVSLDLGHLPSGVYLIEVGDVNNTLVERLMIKR
jgi:hypothetical protein